MIIILHDLKPGSKLTLLFALIVCPFHVERLLLELEYSYLMYFTDTPHS